MGPLVPETNGYINQVVLGMIFIAKALAFSILVETPQYFVIVLNKVYSINFSVKFEYLNFLLSSCAWLVKWHNCNMTNCIIMGITEKFFCNFRTSLQ